MGMGGILSIFKVLKSISVFESVMFWLCKVFDTPLAVEELKCWNGEKMREFMAMNLKKKTWH